jgi:hypothetical protein
MSWQDYRVVGIRYRSPEGWCCGRWHRTLSGARRCRDRFGDGLGDTGRLVVYVRKGRDPRFRVLEDFTAEEFLRWKETQR